MLLVKKHNNGVEGFCEHPINEFQFLTIIKNYFFK